MQQDNKSQEIISPIKRAWIIKILLRCCLQDQQFKYNDSTDQRGTEKNENSDQSVFRTKAKKGKTITQEKATLQQPSVRQRKTGWALKIRLRKIVQFRSKMKLNSLIINYFLCLIYLLSHLISIYEIYPKNKDLRVNYHLIFKKQCFGCMRSMRLRLKLLLVWNLKFLPKTEIF